MVFNGYDFGEIGSERLIVYNIYLIKNTITDLGHCGNNIE